MGDTVYEGTIKFNADVTNALNGFTKIQNATKKLDLGKTFDNKLADSMTRLIKNGQKMSEAINSGFKKTSDLTKYKTGMNGVESAITAIVRQIRSIDPSKLKINNPELDVLREKLKALNEEIKKISESFQKTKQFKGFEKFLNSVDSSKHSTKLLNDFFNALKNGDIGEIETQLKSLELTQASMSKRTNASAETIQFWTQVVKLAKAAVEEYKSWGIEVVTDREEVLTKITEEETKAFKENERTVKELSGATEDQAKAAKNLMTNISGAAEKQSEFNQSLDRFKQRATYFFGMENGVRLFRRAIRAAFNDVKELDKVMTQTAVVTNFSIGDLWSQLSDYTKRANALGVSIKGAYEAATLYYQQGLKTNEVIEVSTQTLKMARIAGLDAATATDRMTNALRGFNMVINETSAERISDVYSKLAAITASNVDEISTAMTKVASLANNANMEFEKTSAFLAQIIETTRESAETAGTALKTVVARFSEVKELYSKGQLLGSDEEGEEININRVSKALQTAGINLNEYFAGMKGLDDIFLELASKWDKLDEVQQRYIATMAAGSRQQSRFIAMMQDYDRTLELVDAAENAAGASTEQFNKTLDSLETKLNQLKNAWTTFTTGIANSSVIKVAVDLVRNLLGVINTLTGKLPGLLKMLANTAILAGGLKLGKTLIPALLSKMGAAWRGEGVKAGLSFGQGFTTTVAKIKMVPMNFKQFFVGPEYTTSVAAYTKQLDLLKGKVNTLTPETTAYNNALSESLTMNKAMINVENSSLTQKEKAILYDEMLTNSTLTNKIATEGATTADIKEAAAEEGVNFQRKQGVLLSLRETLAKIGVAITTKLSTKEKIKETVAQWSLNTAMMVGLLYVGLIVAAIVALVFVIKALIKASKKQEEEQKKFNESLQKGAEQAKEVKDAYEEIADAMDGLKEKEEILSSYIKGTDTWKKALDDVNEQINDILEKGPQYSKYFTWDSTLQKYVYDPAAVEKAVSNEEKYAFVGELAQEYRALTQRSSMYNDTMQKWADVNNMEGASYQVSTIEEAIEFTKKLVEADEKRMESALANEEAASESWNGQESYIELYLDSVIFDEGKKRWVPETPGDETGLGVSNVLNQYIDDMQSRFNTYQLSASQIKFLSELTGLSSDYIKTYMQNMMDNADEWWEEENAKSPQQRENDLRKFYGSLDLGDVSVKGDEVKLNGQKIEDAWEIMKIYEEIDILQANYDRIMKFGTDAEKALLNGTTTVGQLKELLNSTDSTISTFAAEQYNSTQQAQQGLAQILGTDPSELENYNAQFLRSLFDHLNGIPEEIREDFIKQFLTLTDQEQIKALDVLNLIPSDGFKTVKNLNTFIGSWNEAFGPSSGFANLTNLLKQNVRWSIELGYDMSDNIKNTKNAIDALKGTDSISPEDYSTMVQAGVSEDLFVQTPEGTYIYGDSKNKAISSLLDSIFFEAEMTVKNLATASDDTRQDYLEDLFANIGRIMTSGSSEMVEGMIESDWFQKVSKDYGDALQIYFKALSKSNPILRNYSTYKNQTVEGMAALFTASDGQQDVDDFVSKLSEASYYLSQGADEAKKYQYQLSDLIILARQLFGPGVSVELLAENWELLERVVNNDANAFIEFQKAVIDDSLWPIEENIDDLIAKMDEFGLIKLESLSDIARESFESLGWTVIETENGVTLFNKAYSNFLTNISKGSGSDSSNNWENPYDRLHNLLEHITAVQKERNHLEREYNKLVREPGTSYKETQQVLKKRLENLHDEYQLQKRLKEEREEDMENYYNEHQSEIGKYAYYKDGRVYIDWGALENSNFTNDEGKNIEDIISKMKELRDSRDDAADKLGEIDDEVFETRQTIIENYRNFEDRVLAAVTADEQKRIDMMSKINDSINDATDKLFDQAQKQIDEYRQTRENEKTESEIADKEARLAYLRRDTSGAHALEIKKLEEELGDARQDYADSRIDQALEEMRNEADLAAEQRAEQIAIEQGILDYQKEIGYFWARVSSLISTAFNADGTPNYDSELIQLLQETEGFQGLSELGKAEWIKDVSSQMVQLVDEKTLREILYGDTNPGHSVVDSDDVADGVKKGEDDHGTATSSDVSSAANEIIHAPTEITETEYASKYGAVSEEVAGTLEQAGRMPHYGQTTADIWNYYQAVAPTIMKEGQRLIDELNASNLYNKGEKMNQLKALLNQFVDAYNQYWMLATAGTNPNLYLQHFAGGGLASSTGPAWLDGSRSHPEYVLNAAQTEGFLQLVDMFTKPQDAFSSTPGFGDNYFDIDINAEIGSDYDVDQLVERIKTRITEDSMYRNVNAINFIR